MMNRLSDSTSPYLLQHASNPVDWYPWSELALQEAKSKDKPIFLSIGYSACHWCHVMAHESFEDPETAALMNAHFVNIKVDREERPDLDSIYMEATMAMTGSGGWPMSVFLTPDLKPFYCGTYFPPIRRYNLPSFRELLTSIASAWEKEKENILIVGDKVVEHIQAQNKQQPGDLTLSPDILEIATRNLMQAYDWSLGGWGQAPKFPQPMAINFLFTRDETEKKAALHTLSCMARGGMYDVVGGGFSRYSTDLKWMVPHFEKMLYDNAQLARVYLHAWQITGDPDMKKIVTETLTFISRELTNSEGGFLSSLDADSEHEEGKYYVWSYEEIVSILGEDFEFFKAAYGIIESGNWEGKIILQRTLDDGTLASQFGASQEPQKNSDWLKDKMSFCHSRLLREREKRIPPAKDDKVLTCWNALTLSTFAAAARAFHGTDLEKEYLSIAQRNAGFLLAHLSDDIGLHRSWREGQAGREVFLEDYAALILALLDLYQSDFNNTWFIHALDLTESMMRLFNDPSGGFFDTPEGGENLIYRPKELMDNATPSGNSLACEALLRMAALTGRADFSQKADGMLSMVAEEAMNQPLGYAHWLTAMDLHLAGIKQIAILGDKESRETQAMIDLLNTGFHPHWVAAASSLPLPERTPELLHARPLVHNKTTAYVCEEFICRQPVTDVDSLCEKLLL